MRVGRADDAERFWHTAGMAEAGRLAWWRRRAGKGVGLILCLAGFGMAGGSWGLGQGEEPRQQSEEPVRRMPYVDLEAVIVCLLPFFMLVPLPVLFTKLCSFSCLVLMLPLTEVFRVWDADPGKRSTANNEPLIAICWQEKSHAERHQNLR